MLWIFHTCYIMPYPLGLLHHAIFRQYTQMCIHVRMPYRRTCTPGPDLAIASTRGCAVQVQTAHRGVLRDKPAEGTCEGVMLFVGVISILGVRGVRYYHSGAKYCTTWDYHLWGKYPRSLRDSQVFLPQDSDPSGSMISAATA
jgi:hypothetical protein